MVVGLIYRLPLTADNSSNELYAYNPKLHFRLTNSEPKGEFLKKEISRYIKDNRRGNFIY